MAGSPTPAPAPLPTLPGPPFEITAATFFTDANGNDRVKVEIKRNLSLSEQVDELYLDFILRGSDKPQPNGDRTPAYYGDAYARRTQTPLPEALSKESFAIEMAPRLLSSAALPGQHTGPARHVPHPFEVRYFKKAPQEPFAHHDCQLVNITDTR